MAIIVKLRLINSRHITTDNVHFVGKFVNNEDAFSLVVQYFNRYAVQISFIFDKNRNFKGKLSRRLLNRTLYFSNICHLQLLSHFPTDYCPRVPVRTVPEKMVRQKRSGGKKWSFHYSGACGDKGPLF